MTLRTLTAASVAALALAACSDGTGPGSGQTVSLLVSARSLGAAAAAEDTVTVGGATLVISSVELVARQIRLRRAADSCPDSTGSSGSGDCGSLRIDPMLISVPLGDSATEALEAEVEAGSYDRIQFQIHKPAGSNDAAFLAANPDFSGISVRVTGSYEGIPFSYTTDFTAVETVNLDTPLVVEEGVPSALTLHLDVSGWFLNGGALIDPAALAGSQQLRSRVQQNIRNSFKAFPDADQDGSPQ